MRAVATGAVLTGAMALAGWSAAWAAVARIERNPDPLPRDLLAREPKGKEVLINRPVRGWLTLRSFPIGCVKQSRLAGFDLDAQAFTASTVDVDGLQFAAYAHCEKILTW